MKDIEKSAVSIKPLKESKKDSQTPSTKRKLLPKVNFKKIGKLLKREALNIEKLLFSLIKLFALLSIILWAINRGFFKDFPGLENFGKMLLTIFDEIFGFLADILKKIVNLIHLSDICNFIRNLAR